MKDRDTACLMTVTLSCNKGLLGAPFILIPTPSLSPSLSFLLPLLQSSKGPWLQAVCPESMKLTSSRISRDGVGCDCPPLPLLACAPGQVGQDPSRC